MTEPDFAALRSAMDTLVHHLWHHSDGSDSWLLTHVDAVLAASVAGPHGAVEQFDIWSATQLQHWAADPLDPDDGALAVRYCAALEAIWLGLGEPAHALRRRADRATLLIDLHRGHEAESLLRSALLDLEKAHGAFATRLRHRDNGSAIEPELHRLLGNALEAQGREREAALEYESAASQFSTLNAPDDSAQAWALAAWAHTNLAADAATSGDLETAEAAAVRGRDLGRRYAPDAAAVANLRLAAIHGVHFEPTRMIAPLIDALTAATELGLPEVGVMAHAMLAVAHMMRADPSLADTCARRALAAAEHVRDPVFTQAVTELLSAAAASRMDMATAQALLAATGAPASSEITSLVQALQRACGLSPAVPNVAETVGSSAPAEVSLESRHAATARDTRAAEYDPAGLIHAVSAALAGDRESASRHLDLVQAAIDAQLTSGNPAGAAVHAWLRPVIDALSAYVGGDRDAAVRSLLARRDELIRQHNPDMAARLAMMTGLLVARDLGPVAALDLVLPAYLTLSRRLATLPSSAERTSARETAAASVPALVALIESTGDQCLLSEFIEVIRGQGIPDAAVGFSPTPSLGSLMSTVLLKGTPTAHPGEHDTARWSEWHDQETLLPPPVPLLMPWGSIALERFLHLANEYEPYLDPGAAPVALHILR